MPGIDHETEKYFRKKIASRMHEMLGYESIRSVARSTGFHHETVRRYLSGTSRMPTDFVASIVRVYGLDANTLLVEHARPPTKESIEVMDTTSLISELTRRMVKMEESIVDIAIRCELAEAARQPQTAIRE